LLFFHYSFSFALQTWFLELEVALPWHFKSVKMKHRWQRSKEVIGDGQFYPSPCLRPWDLQKKKVLGSNPTGMHVKAMSALRHWAWLGVAQQLLGGFLLLSILKTEKKNIRSTN
jgi:hypothetical protein